MSTKTISVTDEAYGRLYNKKKEKESFSEVILRLTGKR
ncbi:MAG: antitoxin VapB family protein, partial [archaeon]